MQFPWYLRQHKNTELFRLLIQTFENPKEDSLTHACAYHAIARASGLEHWELPSSLGICDLLESEKLDLAIINEAKRRLTDQDN
jgi:hypothetical protein